MSTKQTASRKPDASDGRSLMEAIHEGDPSALDELLTRYWEPLVGYAERLLGNRDVAEDVVQEAVLRIWEGRARWTPSHRFRAFLYRVTRNGALNRLKKDRVRRRQGTAVAAVSRSPVPTPEEVLRTSRLQEDLDAALNDLSPKRREVFLLSRYHGHSYREIAEIMGISPQTVANHMTAALDELRTRLDPYLNASHPVPHLRLLKDSPGEP